MPARKDEAKLEHKLAPVIRCIAPFGDALTGKDFNPGDEVPWTVERAKKYPQFVVIE
jgi:hypothetical protein